MNTLSIIVSHILGAVNPIVAQYLVFYGRKKMDRVSVFVSAIEIRRKIGYTNSDMNTKGFMGNAHIQETLKGELGHAYLISGPEIDERRALASLMARSRICQREGQQPCMVCVSCEKAGRGIHPDILRVEREPGKEIPVAAIRQIVHDAATLPNEAEYKVYIIEEADALNQSAQNAFLKILEEPPSFVTFLLLAENPLQLLSTVRSRCVHLSLVPEAEVSAPEETETQELAKAFWDAYLSGGLDLLHFCVSLEKADRQVLEGFVEACYMRFVAGFGQRGANAAKLQAGIRLFDSLRDDLRFNVSTGHLSGKILATLL